MADLDNVEKGRTVIEDGTTGTDLAVNESGSINVVSSFPETPSGATAVTDDDFGDVNSTTGADTFYTITSGKTLTVTLFQGGSEATSAGSVIELFYDPNGDLSVLTRIGTLFVNGDSAREDISGEFAGDGTARIVARRRAYAASAGEMYIQWIGFEE